LLKIKLALAFNIACDDVVNFIISGSAIV